MKLEVYLKFVYMSIFVNGSWICEQYRTYLAISVFVMLAVSAVPKATSKKSTSLAAVIKQVSKFQKIATGVL